MENSMEELRKLVEKEINKITQKGDLTPNELKNAMDAVCLLEKIGRVEYMEDYEEESSGYYRPANRMYSDDGYSHHGGHYGRNGGYYERGRSGHSIKDRMIDKLEGMMDEAQTEYERQTIMKYIDSIRG